MDYGNRPGIWAAQEEDNTSEKGGAEQISRGYDALLSSVIDLLETGRQIAARSVNPVLTMT